MLAKIVDQLRVAGDDPTVAAQRFAERTRAVALWAEYTKVFITTSASDSDDTRRLATSRLR